MIFAGNVSCNRSFQGDASVVGYSNCQCSSAFCLSLTYCSIYLGSWDLAMLLLWVILIVNVRPLSVCL